MEGALCNGVEDSRCSLLARMTLSLLSGVTGDATDWPLRSLSSVLPGCKSVKVGPDMSPTEGTVRSTADEAVESMVDTAMTAASCSGVS